MLASKVFCDVTGKDISNSPHLTITVHGSDGNHRYDYCSDFGNVLLSLINCDLINLFDRMSKVKLEYFISFISSGIEYGCQMMEIVISFPENQIELARQTLPEFVIIDGSMAIRINGDNPEEGQR